MVDVQPSTTCLPPGLDFSELTPEEVFRIADSLTEAQPLLAEIPDHRLLDAWNETIAVLLDRTSEPRRRVASALASSRLSPAGVEAGLDAILGGVSGPAAERLFAQAGAPVPGFAWVVLAASPPALAVQTLLPALALRRPVWFKSSTAEPTFTPALIELLAQREPVLRRVYAATAWAGGDRELEDPLIERARRVIAYGGGETMRDLERRAGAKLVAHGPKLSLALVDASVDVHAVAPPLARDIALFDQRGCLSLQAIYTSGPSRPLADALAAALQQLAEDWPPGPLDPHAAASVQQLRAVAQMRRLHQPELDLRAGTVVVEEAGSALEPSPGLRTVRVYPLDRLDALPSQLEPWRGRLQGAALAGAEARALEEPLRRLGFSRFAAPGELQRTGADWHNGGISPLAALA